MRNFDNLILNSNEDREASSPGATEAGFNTSRSNIKNKNIISDVDRKRNPILELNRSTSRSNIKN